MRLSALHAAELILNFQFLSFECVDHQVVILAVLHFCLNLPVQFLMAPFQRRDVAFSRHKQLLSASWTGGSSQIIHALSMAHGPLREIRCKTFRDQLTKGMSGARNTGFRCSRFPRNRKPNTGLNWLRSGRSMPILTRLSPR